MSGQPIADSNPLTSPYTDCVVYVDEFDTYKDYDETCFGWQLIPLARCYLCREEIANTPEARGHHSTIAHCAHCGEKVSDHLSTENPCRDSEQIRAINAEDDFLARGA